MIKPLSRQSIDRLVALSERFDGNWRRCVRLFGLLKNPELTDQQTNVISETGMDIIRAMLVFFHASFEDFLREVCRELWLTRPPGEWKQVDFVDENGERTQKMTMSELAQFRGMTVDALIEKWFNSWLDRQSYNKFSDVMSLFRELGVREESFRKYHSHVDFVMTRRHRIVHNADFERPSDTVPADWPTSDVYKFMIATYALHSLLIELLRELGTKVNFSTLLENSKGEALKFVAKAELQRSDQFPFVW